MATIALIIGILAIVVNAYLLTRVLRAERAIKRMKQVTDWHQPLG